MRLDLFLKVSRLVTRRTLAQEMCEAGAVKLNGTPAKSAHVVRPGDLLVIRSRGRLTTMRVLEVPAKQVSKAGARSLFETLGVESYDAEADTARPD
jgi:ribosomal 50S subunit-recycling heat shock protein